MAYYKTYRDLEIWVTNMDLVVLIYNLNLQNDFSLRDQLRRASISIPSNISEGFGRKTNKEFIKYLYTAKGSTAEVSTQLEICLRIGYINESKYNKLDFIVKKIYNQIGGFISYLSKYRQ